MATTSREQTDGRAKTRINDNDMAGRHIFLKPRTGGEELWETRRGSEGHHTVICTVVCEGKPKEEKS